MIREGAVVQGLTRRGVVKSSFAMQIPASIETLIKCAHASRGLIAARYATKSEAA
jgi:hypothetical protein